MTSTKESENNKGELVATTNPSNTANAIDVATNDMDMARRDVMDSEGEIQSIKGALRQLNSIVKKNASVAKNDSVVDDDDAKELDGSSSSGRSLIAITNTLRIAAIKVSNRDKHECGVLSFGCIETYRLIG